MTIPNDNIFNNFLFNGTIEDVSLNKSGLINGTFILTYSNEGSTHKYILQRINVNVFKRPIELMENVSNITEHIRKATALENGDVNRCALNIVKTINDELCYIDEDGDYWRAYDFIENAIAYDKIEKKEHFYAAGVALGQFQKKLKDYPMDRLFETIENFHNTPVRYDNFCKAVKENAVSRSSLVEEEIEFFRARKGFYDVVTKELDSGSIPLRVTHNDTKINNVMLDSISGEAVCLIDLDTVMPGSALYDFGDSIRFGTNTTAEDDANLDKIGFDLELFEAYTRGYLSVMKDKLTEREIALLPESAILMTLECGMRFLTDYIEGDIYFGVSRENHNLDRAKNQMRLASLMEKNIEKMREIVKFALD